MANRENVINALELCTSKIETRTQVPCEACSYHNTKYHGVLGDGCCNIRSLHRDCLALLKAQEPVKPVVDIDTWKCGNCGHTLEHQELLGDNVLFHEQYNFCPECGRAVKWND